MTTWANVSFENETVDSALTARTIDGVSFNGATTPEVLAVGYVRDDIATAFGTKYVQWNVPAVDPENDPHGLGPSITFSPAITIASGTTYYLGAAWRFEKISNGTIWESNWCFDKLLEMRGTNYRVMITAGYSDDDSREPYSANQFCFNVYESPISGLEWYYEHNQGGYTSTAPYMCEFSRWYSVVLGVLAHESAGAVYLWINGTKVLETTGVKTINGSANIDEIGMSGTVSQAAYNAANHYRYIDGIVLTDEWDVIVAAGLNADPESGTGSKRTLFRK